MDILDLDKLVGLVQTEAIARAEDAGFRTHIVRRDKENFGGTGNYRIDRLNFEIDNGKVTKAWIG